MAAKSSDLDDQKLGVNIQTESHTSTQPNGQNGPEEIEAFGGVPSWSTSQSLAMKPTSDCPDT